MHTYILLTLFLAMVVLVFTTLRKHKKRDKETKNKTEWNEEEEFKDRVNNFEQYIKNKKERFLTIFWYKDNLKKFDEYAKKKHKYKFTHIENCETFDKYWFEFDYD